MTRIRCTLAMLLGVFCTADASAQFFPPPGGIGFQYNGGNLRIGGFFPAYGVVPINPYGTVMVGYPYCVAPAYGSINTRISVQVNTPPVVLVKRRSLAPSAEEYDVAGIDLDAEPPSKIWGGNKPALAKAPGKAVELVKAPAKPMEVAKVPLPPEPKPAEKVVPPPPPAPPPPAKVDLRPEWQRLLDDGTLAFRNGEFGVAILRFRQADTDRAIFLEAQACIAVGKYREAIQLLHEGLRNQPKWPDSVFRPKVELYGNQEDVWKQHRNRLEVAQRDQPKDADLLFLLGYLAWFDGERVVAVDYFQQSRALAADARWADLFLKAGKAM